MNRWSQQFVVIHVRDILRQIDATKHINVAYNLSLNAITINVIQGDIGIGCLMNLKYVGSILHLSLPLDYCKLGEEPWGMTSILVDTANSPQYADIWNLRRGILRCIRALLEGFSEKDPHAPSWGRAWGEFCNGVNDR